jgi:heme-degrading monooxygenase HmoA
MTSDTPEPGPVTFVNVFEIDPKDIDEFLDGWRERANFMRTQPGFRSFRLLRALSPDSRFQLVNVAEWESAEAIAAARAKPEFQASVRGVSHEVKANPSLYQAAVEFTA